MKSFYLLELNESLDVKLIIEGPYIPYRELIHSAILGYFTE